MLKPYIFTSTSTSHILLILKPIPMIFVTLDASKKGLQNLFNVQRLLTNVEKFIKLYLQIFFTSLFTYHIKICSSLNKHIPNFLSHIVYQKRNSIGLYKDNFFTLSNHSTLCLVCNRIQIFVFQRILIKKSHLNVVLFSIGHFSRESYVATRFSPP